jgi:hypothetical protein
VVLRLGVSDPLREVALTDALELEWRLTAGAGHGDRVGGEVEQHLARERVVRWMQWRHAVGDVPEVVAVGETVQHRLDCLTSVVIGRSAPRHADPRYAPTLPRPWCSRSRAGPAGTNGTSMMPLRRWRRAFDDCESGIASGSTEGAWTVTSRMLRQLAHHAFTLDAR